MTIDEAIAKEKEEAKYQNSKYDKCPTRMLYCCEMCFHNPKCNEVAEQCEQRAEWLEELKDYRDKNKMVVRIDCVNSEEFKDIEVKLAKEQYNKAIDDYKSGIKEELERFEVKNLDTCVLYDLMDRKAERLKAGGNINE